MDRIATLRPATEGDYELLCRFLPQLETGDELPDEATYRSQYQHRFQLLSFDDESPHGCAIVDVLSDTGYVRVVVIDPSMRAKGQGRHLMNLVAAQLRARGCTQWCLNVKLTNAPAIALYERVGMKRAYESRAFRLPWARIDALPHSTRAVQSRTLLPADDALIEQSWSLPAGQLDGWRTMPGQHLLLLEDPLDLSDRRVGFARFNPSFPGAFPFRIAEHSLMRSLFDAMRPYREARYDYVRVVVEDDEALCNALVAAGAEQLMHIMHMRGPLPDVNAQAIGIAPGTC